MFNTCLAKACMYFFHFNAREGLFYLQVHIYILQAHNIDTHTNIMYTITIMDQGFTYLYKSYHSV